MLDRSQRLQLRLCIKFYLFGLHPYKIQLVQELKPQNQKKHRVFANGCQNPLETDPNIKKLCFSDEVHFW